LSHCQQSRPHFYHPIIFELIDEQRLEIVGDLSGVIDVINTFSVFRLYFQIIKSGSNVNLIKLAEKIIKRWFTSKQSGRIDLIASVFVKNEMISTVVPFDHDLNANHVDLQIDNVTLIKVNQSSFETHKLSRLDPFGHCTVRHVQTQQF
jgi:hypothetical protein